MQTNQMKMQFFMKQAIFERSSRAYWPLPLKDWPIAYSNDFFDVWDCSCGNGNDPFSFALRSRMGIYKFTTLEDAIEFARTPQRLPATEYPNANLCPSVLQESIQRYAKDHIETGSFLRLVLCNDLWGAAHRADCTNLPLLPHIVHYVARHVPSHAWGSPARVEAWLATKGEPA